MAINQKQSYSEYTVSTPQGDFAIGFEDYNEGEKDHIKVTVDGEDAASQGYTVLRKNALTIAMEPFVPSGIVRLTRETNIDNTFYKFTAGAIFDAANVDANFLQILHSQQEVRDRQSYVEGRVLPLVNGLEEALAAADAASHAAQEAADAAASAAAQTQYYLRYYSPTITYPKGARIMLANGDTVISTVDGNTTDPNVSMTKWVYSKYTIENVKFWGAKGDGVTDDAPAFQACIDAAIARKSKRIFIPFDNSERYRFGSTVNIPASGFTLKGNRTPSYHLNTEGVGYIFGDATVTALFNYGVGGNYPSNQLLVSGLAGNGLWDAPRTQNFIRMNQNNNGPHRGVLFTDTSAQGFNNVFHIEPTNTTFIGAATVVLESGCCFTGNENTAYSTSRVFGFAMNSIQSEAGGRVSGKFDGGVSFRDNMLEGQSNPIDINSNQPSLIVENNYFEGISGDFITRLRGTNGNALFTERPNYISSVNATDIHRLSSTVRLHAPYRFNQRSDRHSLYSFIGTNLAYGSLFDGAGYVGVTDIPTDGLRGFCDPKSLLPPRVSAVIQRFVGSSTLNTPFGTTTTGLKVTGTSPYVTINKGWAAGDVITAVALVKLSNGQAPTFTVYGSDGTAISSIGQNTVTRMTEGWHVVVISGKASTSSTTTRWRFTSTTEIEVAACGVDITPQADFKTFNNVKRAEIQVFNPLPSVLVTNKFVDLRTLNIPTIAAGTIYKTTEISVLGAAVGDKVVTAPNIGLQGIVCNPRVSAPNTIELELCNYRNVSVTLGPVQWNTEVFK